MGKYIHRLLLLKLDTQPRSHLLVEVCIEQGMDHYTTGTDRIIFLVCMSLPIVVHEQGMFTVPQPLQHGTPPPPCDMPRSLRE